MTELTFARRHVQISERFWLGDYSLITGSNA
jgi:hypothetical protein